VILKEQNSGSAKSWIQSEFICSYSMPFLVNEKCLVKLSNDEVEHVFMNDVLFCVKM